MMKKLRLRSSFAVFLGLFSLALHAQGLQQLVVAGLRSVHQNGQFNAVKVDSSGNLLLLLDQKDGVRLLKTDSTATQVLAQTQLGAAGDVGLAMALDPAGNIYIAGTSTSGALASTSGAAFPAPVDTSVNSFVAKLDPNLNLQFLTFGGASRSTAVAVSATSDAVFITGIIYGSSLPVTPSGIIQAPASGSTQNGFVERFSSDGTSLQYATYLSGFVGDTTPTAIVADSADEAYVGGFTTSSGYPTVSAIIPRTLGTTSGFLTRLTPGGDGIDFSTFIPGAGISSLALDNASSNLLLTGQISLGQFPVNNAPMPLVNTPYQVLIRLPLDGSSVLSATVLAPGTQSFVASASGGAAWVDGTLPSFSYPPLLPLTPLSDVGSSYAMRIVPQGSQGATAVDESARFGGLGGGNSDYLQYPGWPNYVSLPISLNGIDVDSAGSPILAGSAIPTASGALLATQTFDLPLVQSPTTALPSMIQDALPPSGTCSGSLCSGSAAYLARIHPADGASIAVSADTFPVVLLRNLGSAAATNLQITASGFTENSSCGPILGAGAECSIVLSGSGPGTMTVQADNASSQTVNLPASSTTASGLVFSPHEIDFGIQSSTSSPATRTITVTNLGPAQSFASVLNGHLPTAVSFTESSSTCPLVAQNTKQLDAGASCQITVAFSPSSSATNDGPASGNWTIGDGNVFLTGYSEAAPLSPSATEIDFGTQFYGGISLPRYLYLSNNSATAISHTAVALPADSPFTVTDRCPSSLLPHTICQIQINYAAATSTSSDSTTLSLDQGISVLITGQTIPPAGTTGSSANPNLGVSPTAVSFVNSVAVTGVSSETQTVTLNNTGSSDFPLSFTLNGDFIDETNCGSTLAAGASCKVILTFAPSQPGARQGTLSVTGGSGTSPILVSLSGTATAILPANNGTLDFGNVLVGQPSVQWYKVSQPFTSLSAATLNASFKVILVEDLGYGHGTLSPTAFLTATTGSCLNCWLGVQFTPPATGPQTASLSLLSVASGNPYVLSLTGNGLVQAGLVLSPTSQDFGTLSVGSTSAPALFTLTNLTGANISFLSSVSTTGDFSLSSASTGGAACTGTLAANASCFFQVVFAPTTTGQRIGTASVQTSAGTIATSLMGSGSADTGVTFNPGALVFNNVPGMAATNQSITVTNSSNGTIQIGTPSNSNAAFQTSTACGTLAPAAICTITVTFVPATATVTDTLQIPATFNVGGTPTVTVYSIPLSSTYTAASAGLQILPGSIKYGSAPVNAVDGTQVFTVNNLTTKSLALNIAIPRQFVLSGTPCTQLDPNGSCNFSVSFLPATNGDLTGTLSAQGVPSDGSAAVGGLGYMEGYGVGANSLTITGNISPGRLVSFGQIPSGQSAMQTLTLTNTSSATASTADSTVTIHRVSSQWPFLSTTTCGTMLAVGQSCTVTITYTPLNQIASGSSSVTPGTDAGVLTIESDAVSSPDSINLAGTSTPETVSAPSNSAPLVALSLSQSSLTFPTTSVGFSSAAQTVTLTNSGSTVIHVANLIASTDFTVTSSCSALVPGDSCPLAITFTPQISSQSSSLRPGYIEIRSDATASLEFLTLVGTASPSTLVFQPTSLNFGSQLVGSITTLPLQITNTANTATVFNQLSTTGDFSIAGNCPQSGQPLAAQASCTAQISFKPTTAGIRSGTFSITSSASDLPLRAILTGTGVQSHLQVNPISLSFGDTPVGGTTTLSLTLANNGTASITGLSFAINGDYAITTPCSFKTLSAGSSCSVTIAFTPTATGTRTGTLAVTSSDPSSPVSISLNGNGTQSNPSTGTAAFSLTVNGGSSASQTITQTQTANYTLTVTPLNGFAGSVVLNCNAATASSYSLCSLLPATVTISGTSQSSTATISTISTADARSAAPFHLPRAVTLCLLAPSTFLFWRYRKTLLARPSALLLVLVGTTLMLWISGCGSGANSTMRATPPGSYQFTVTANDAAGTAPAQTVVLNLTVQ